MRILSLVLAGILLASCDYPEQGFFRISAIDGNGTSVASHIFEVVELVDDTDLTYGFEINVFDIPRKTIYNIPFRNAPEFTRRGWLFGIGDADYGAGDLALDFTHDDMLHFVGAWRAGGGGSVVWPLAGSLPGTDENGKSRIQFSLPTPPWNEQARQWVVEPLTPAKAGEVLGKLSGYKRVKAKGPGDLDPAIGRDAQAAGQPQANAPLPVVDDQPRYTPPPLGGRR
jgi:hypothetical protein